MASVVSGPTPMATIFMPSSFKSLIIERTASGSEGSPSVSVRKISGFFDRNVGNKRSYTSASGVLPFAFICASHLAAVLFHCKFSGFINQHVTFFCSVLNA